MRNCWAIGGVVFRIEPGDDDTADAQGSNEQYGSRNQEQDVAASLGIGWGQRLWVYASSAPSGAAG